MYLLMMVLITPVIHPVAHKKCTEKYHCLKFQPLCLLFRPAASRRHDDICHGLSVIT